MAEAIIVNDLGKRFNHYHADRPRTIMEAALSGFRGLGKVDQFWALRHISFTVQFGEMLGVLGHNGAGKSTLLQLIGGVSCADEGWVQVNGRIGALLDLGAGFSPDLTGRENVYVMAIAAGLTRREVTRRLETIVEFAELGEFIDNPLRTYSSGMQMRLAFSVAVHTNPQVLLVDEFLSVGDLAFQSKCLQRITQLKEQEGCAIVLISHSPDQIKNLCDRALWLKYGEIVAYGEPAVVTGQYTTEMRTTTQHLTPDRPVQRSSSGIELQVNHNRFGSLEAEITGVYLHPPSGLDAGDTLRVDIEYQATQLISAPIFSLSISREQDGQICLDTNTEAMGLALPDIQGNGHISLMVERLDLVKGNYFVNVGIFRADWSHAYDFHWHVYPLLIQSSPIHQAILAPPCQWQWMITLPPRSQAHDRTAAIANQVVSTSMATSETSELIAVDTPANMPIASLPAPDHLSKKAQPSIAIEPASQRSSAMMLWLLIFTVVGTGIRLWLAWKTNLQLPDTPARLGGDEPGYDGLAMGLLNGSFFQWPGRTPVYPMFLAACYALFGHSYAIVLYIQALVGAATIPLTFILACRFTGAWSSMMAAAMIACHPTLVYQPLRLYSETLYTTLMLATMLGMLWALEKPQVYRYIWAGVTIAITNLCRPTAMLFPFVLPVLMPWQWLWKRRLNLFAVYLSTIVLITAPWTYHNYRTHHVFLPYSVSIGALWQGSPEFYHLSAQGKNLLDIWAEQLNPAKNGGHDPFSIQGDRYFSKRAIASIKAEPLLYARYCIQKAAYFWIGNPVIDWPGHAIFSVKAMLPYFSKQQIAGKFLARLFPLVVCIAFWFIRRRWREFLPLLALVAYFMAIHAITYPEVRYSEPFYPVLVTIFATAVSDLQQRVGRSFQMSN